MSQKLGEESHSRRTAVWKAWIVCNKKGGERSSGHRTGQGEVVLTLMGACGGREGDGVRMGLMEKGMRSENREAVTTNASLGQFCMKRS